MGVAHAADGRLLLLEAPLALFPGEQVEASVQWKARHGQGRVLRWLQGDRRRREAQCPVAGTCGGCDLWEAGPQAGDLKRQMVEDLFRRQLGESTPWDWRPAPEDARRHRIQLHWDGAALGYFRRHSHSLVPVQACPAAAEPLSLAIPRLQAAIQGKQLPTRPGRWEVATGTPPGRILATDERGHSWELETDGWHPADQPLRHRIGNHELHQEPGAFFQVCAPWAAQAFGELLAQWDVKGATLYDLYGGVGLFSVLLGPRFQHRVLVESGETAVAWARRNLARAELSGDCLVADVPAWMPEGLGTAADVILLDPPREGLELGLCERLQQSKAGHLVLIGCDGAAFCRDLKRLAPPWKLTRLAALDLFPMTHHVECVALLEPAP
jgi:23S rRNA (uracil1939-C5)-methyltransferase